MVVEPPNMALRWAAVERTVAWVGARPSASSMRIHSASLSSCSGESSCCAARASDLDILRKAAFRPSALHASIAIAMRSVFWIRLLRSSTTNLCRCWGRVHAVGRGTAIYAVRSGYFAYGGRWTCRCCLNGLLNDCLKIGMHNADLVMQSRKKVEDAEPEGGRKFLQGYVAEITRRLPVNNEC